MLQSETQKLAVNFESLNELHAFQKNGMHDHMSGHAVTDMTVEPNRHGLELDRGPKT